MATEFFRTLRDAEAWASNLHLENEVYGLDKPGTVRKFRAEQDDALFWERNEAENARAVVVFWR